MNSLESYKDQVYNLGSPVPTPVKDPLACLPRNVEHDFDFVDTPTGVKKPTTRKSQIPTGIPKCVNSAGKHKAECCDLNISPTKIQKMISDEQFENYLAKSKKDTEEAFNNAMSEFLKQSKKKKQ